MMQSSLDGYSAALIRFHNVVSRLVRARSTLHEYPGFYRAEPSLTPGHSAHWWLYLLSINRHSTSGLFLFHLTAEQQNCV